jgi:hypothetical protein
MTTLNDMNTKEELQISTLVQNWVRKLPMSTKRVAARLRT